jgi:hypothetical protein
LRPFTAYGDEYYYGNEFWDLAVKYRYVYRYSEPAIILWQRNGPANSEGNFKLLAYRTIQAGDGLTYCASGAGSCAMNGNDLRLKPWVTLMVRVIEGYELPFTSGRVIVSAGISIRRYGYGYNRRSYGADCRNAGDVHTVGRGGFFNRVRDDDADQRDRRFIRTAALYRRW